MIIAMLALLGLGTYLIVEAFDDDGSDNSDEPDDPSPVRGTEDGELLVGTEGNDIILAFAGNDLVLGQNGDDTIGAGNGADLLIGGRGDDMIEGGNGDDTLVGGKGEDTLDGGDGDDVLYGADNVRDIDFAEDLLAAQTEQEALDVLTSPAYIEPTRDLGQADVLNGGAGEDLLILGANDTATSGEGEDLVVIGDWMATEEGHAVVTDLRDAQTSGDILVFEYDDDAPAPVMTIDHDDDAGVSYLYADGTLVLEIINTPGAPKLDVKEIVMAGY